MPTEPHIIRLRGRWQLASETTTAAGSPLVTLQRWFHRPSGLDAATRVVLSVVGLTGLRRALLNGQMLPARPVSSGAWQIVLPAPLRPRNQITLELEAPASSAWAAATRDALAAGNVWLEISRDDAAPE